MNGIVGNYSHGSQISILFFCLDTKETKGQGWFIFLTPKLLKIAKQKKLAFSNRYLNLILLVVCYFELLQCLVYAQTGFCF
jgi:hypothetical protein